MSITDYSIVNITHLSVQRSFPIFGYIDIQNSVTLNIANSQMTSFFIFIFPNGFFVFARNNCTITISNSIFGNGNHSWLMTNVFGITNFSRLYVNNCNFENTGCSYSRLSTASLHSKVIFTNCSIVKTSGLTVTHNSVLQIRNSTIVNSTDTWQMSALMEISDNSHVIIVYSSIKNNILQSKNLIFITSNSSLTLSNCLYSDNNLPGHIVLSGGNITIHNTRFVNNSIIKSVTGPAGILVANGTCFTIINVLFDKNTGYGTIASLIMTISADTILIKRCNIRYNFVEFPLLSLVHSTNFIAILSYRSISVMDTTFLNNSINHQYSMYGRFQAVFRVIMTKRIPGSYIRFDNCTFEPNNMIYAYMEGISHVFIHNSLFYLPNREDYNKGHITNDYSYDLYLIGLKSLRLSDSLFYDRRKELELFLGFDFSYPKETKILTLNTQFTLPETTLETRAVNFLQKAEDKGIIDTSFFEKLYHEETTFAAS